MEENKQPALRGIINKIKGSPLFIALIVMIALIIILPPVMKKIKAWKDKDRMKVEVAKPTVVRCVKVTKGSGFENVSLAGKLLAFEDATLSAEKPGRIVEICVDKGMKVGKGQVVIRMDSRMAETALNQARIEKDDSAREFKRYEELKKTGAVSDSQFDTLSRRSQMAQEQFRTAEIVLSNCEIKSPFDGIVDSRLVEAGEYVNEGRNVARVINADKIKTAFDIPEKFVLNVKKGGKVVYRVDSLGRDFTGEVTFIAAAANHENSTFSAELVTDNKGGELRPGMLVEIYLPVQREATDVIIPLTAVIPRKGDYFAFVVNKETKVEKRLVKIRHLVGNDAVIMSGIAEGEDLVVEGQRGIQDGMVVSVEK